MPDSLNYDIKKICAFTGHRTLSVKIDYSLLKQIIRGYIENGYEVFLNGMARGFDLIAAQAVCELKSDYPHIKLIACVPCPEQSSTFSAEDKKKYEEIIKKCDEVILLYDHYFKGCMLARNRFLVDNCSLIIAYIRRNSGGTYYTVKYAAEKGIKVYKY